MVDGEPITEQRPPALLRWSIDNVYADGLYGDPAYRRMLEENQARVVPPLPPGGKAAVALGERSRIAKKLALARSERRQELRSALSRAGKRAEPF